MNTVSTKWVYTFHNAKLTCPNKYIITNYTNAQAEWLLIFIYLVIKLFEYLRARMLQMRNDDLL